MPELPEVETVCRGLTPALKGRVITKVIQNRPNLRFLIPENLKEVMEGQRVESVYRRAKYIIIEMDNGWNVCWHLGMSGRMVIDDENREQKKHDHIILFNNNNQAVFLNDARRFGYVFTVENKEMSECQHFVKLGPEPLGNSFNAVVLYEALQKRKSPIKNALLDQTIVAGLGNIYVCEALYYARIHPKTKSCDLSMENCEILVPIIKDVLNKAIAAGGSSLKDYVQTTGEMGYFQHSFAVYGRAGEQCQDSNCNGVVERIVQSGRSTFYCPEHQYL